MFQGGLDGYRKIFWPDFVEHDGCVFLVLDKALYLQWLRQMNGNKQRVEAIMNHRHIVDLLPSAVDKPARSLVVAFGRLLCDVWKAKLQRDFPTKRFCVSFPLEECEDLTEYEVTFYQTA